MHVGDAEIHFLHLTNKSNVVGIGGEYQNGVYAQSFCLYYLGGVVFGSYCQGAGNLGFNRSNQSYVFT